jgi:two-component system chemotaxis sensor kinase CheA
LAIIPALIVACQERRFAIPQVSLDELVRLQANNASRKIEKIQGKDVLRLRDKLLPVIRLSDVLKINPQYTDPETAIKMSDRRNNIADRRQNSDNSDDDQRIATKDRRQSVQSAINIVVLKESGHQYGLIVDRMVDSEEIVVKPLSGYLKNCKCYSGATIMGDGRVAMILDASGITELANLRFNDLLEEEQRHSETVRSESIKEAQTYLLFRNKGSEFLALNLSLVSRIETISQNDIENIGNKEYLKYDNYSMRVIRPSNFMPVRQSESQNGTSYVIIPKLVKHPIGIITDVVLDVVESSATIDTTNITGTGVQGSMIVDDKLVIIIDIYSLFETAEPDIYKTTINTSNLNGKKILLAEDTSFFKTLECNYLESMGCVVDTVDNGKQAMEKLSNDSYDLVLTDIQMPIMNGIELTRQIKKIPGLQNMPIVALTSLQDEKTEQLCLEAGTNAYEQKLDKEKLFTTLNNIFEKAISGK